jgi:LCP family protein required for cell wall assembly
VQGHPDPQQSATEGEIHRGRRERALAAAVLSCLVPGVGQLYLGRWRRGTAMLLIVGLCLLAAGIARQSRDDLLPRLLLRPSWLLALLVLDVLLLAFRLASVVDAYRIGAGSDRERRRSALVGAGLALVLAVTVAPHAVVGYYDVQTYDLLMSVFRGDSRVGSPPPAGDQALASVRGPITILLIGGDAGPGRTGLRTDTMIVVRVEPATGRVVLLGLPRNLVRVPLPAGPDRAFGCRCFPRPLNELYAYAQEHPAQFPGAASPGVNALRGATQELLGIHIDYHALVNLEGFIDMVDALGGVTIPITEPIHVEVDSLGKGHGGPAFDLRPGRRHLDGQTALAYARSRKTTSDYDRMRRQRCLLGALARQVDTGRLLRAFPSLVRTAKRDVSTDIPLDELPGLIGASGQYRPQVESVGFTPPDYVSGWVSGYPVPDVARIQRTVRAALREPGAAAPIAPTTTATAAAPARKATGTTAQAGAGRQPARPATDPCQPVD